MKNGENGSGDSLAGTAEGRQVSAVSAPLAIAAIILVALALRPSIVSVGPILPSVIDAFHLTHAAASLLTAIPDILMGLLAVAAPWLVRHLGRDRVLIGAIFLLGFSTLARSFAPTSAALFAATGGVGAGIALAGALMAGFIKARFPERSALVMGIYATSLSLGSTIAAAATGPIAEAEGWRHASAIWSLGCLVAVIAWLAVARAEGVPSEAPGTAGEVHGLPWRNRTAWLVAAYFACNNLLFYAVLAWLVPIYEELGYSSSAAGLLLASFTATFMVANPLFGWASRSRDRRAWLALSAGLCLSGLVPTALAPAFAPFLFIPLAAFGLGGAFTLGMTLPLDNAASVDEANAWNSFTLLIGYLVAAAGPLLAGALRDMTGSFGPALWMLCATATFMLALTPALRPHRTIGAAPGAPLR